MSYYDLIQDLIPSVSELLLYLNTTAAVHPEFLTGAPAEERRRYSLMEGDKLSNQAAPRIDVPRPMTGWTGTSSGTERTGGSERWTRAVVWSPFIGDGVSNWMGRDSKET